MFTLEKPNQKFEMFATGFLILACLVLSVVFPTENSFQGISKGIFFFFVFPVLYLKFILRKKISNYGLNIKKRKAGLDLGKLDAFGFRCHSSFFCQSHFLFEPLRAFGFDDEQFLDVCSLYACFHEHCHLQSRIFFSWLCALYFFSEIGFWVGFFAGRSLQFGHHYRRWRFQ
jgi:hypothetical protein